MSPEFWQPGRAVSAEGPLFVRKADTAALDAALAVPNAPCPLIVEVVPNGEPLIGCIAAIVAIQDVANDPIGISSSSSKPLPVSYTSSFTRSPRGRLLHSHLASFDAPVNGFLAACMALRDGLDAYDADDVIRQCARLEHFLESGSVVSKAIPVSLKRLLPSLKKLAELVLRPLEHGSPFIHDSYSEGNKSWWKNVPALAPYCNKVKNDLRASFGGSIPPELRDLEVWLTTLDVRISELKAAMGGTATTPIGRASAYCAAIADRYFATARFGLAILALLRAVDLLLFAKCADLNLIDFSKPGGKYRFPRIPDEMITPLNSFAQLETRVPGLIKLRKPLEDLNAWRNILLQAHHMSLIGEGEAQRIFSDVRPNLPRFGDPDWDKAASAYHRSPPVPLLSILDPDGAVRKAFNVR